MLIRKIFTQRRKQIGTLAKKEVPKTREKILKWLENLNLPNNLRPEQIEANAWQELAKQS